MVSERSKLWLPHPFFRSMRANVYHTLRIARKLTANLTANRGGKVRAP